jgi:hypothetical protein
MNAIEDGCKALCILDSGIDLLLRIRNSKNPHVVCGISYIPKFPLQFQRYSVSASLPLHAAYDVFCTVQFICIAYILVPVNDT